MKVASLWADFKVIPDSRGLNEIYRTFRNLRYSLLGLGTVLGGRALFGGLIGFNAEIEKTKINLATMIGVARGTNTTAQLKEAATLYENLRAKAAELPGTVQEYTSAAERLSMPILKAGASMAQLEEFTVNATLAARSYTAQTFVGNLRDIQQLMAGQFNIADKFSNFLLGEKFTGTEGRKKFKALSQADKLKEISEALKKPAIIEGAALQAETFSGRSDKLKENIKQFFGAVGKPLFDSLSATLKDINDWWGKNKESVAAFTKEIGEGLVTAFKAVKSVFGFLAEDGDRLKALLVAFVGLMGALALRTIIALGPWIALFGAIAGLVYLFYKLKDVIGEVGAALVTAFAIGVLWKYAGGLRTIAAEFLGIARAKKVAAAADAAPGLLGMFGRKGAGGAAAAAGAAPGLLDMFGRNGGASAGGGAKAAYGTVGLNGRRVPPAPLGAPLGGPNFNTFRDPVAGLTQASSLGSWNQWNAQANPASKMSRFTSRMAAMTGFGGGGMGLARAAFNFGGGVAIPVALVADQVLGGKLSDKIGEGWSFIGDALKNVFKGEKGRLETANKLAAGTPWVYKTDEDFKAEGMTNNDAIKRRRFLTVQKLHSMSDEERLAMSVKNPGGIHVSETMAGLQQSVTNNITINGVKDAAGATDAIVTAGTQVAESAMRHAQAAVAGGTK